MEENIMDNQRVRSPRYPSIGLVEAVDLARKIYDEDGMHALDRESAVQHMGYKSLNGASATALASLKQFGLTTDTGKGMLRLTDLALDILEPTSDDTKRGALHAAALTPDLFAALRERFPDKPPSESNLRAHLVRQGFTVAAIKSIMPAYLSTHEYTSNLEAADSYRQPSGTTQILTEDRKFDGEPIRPSSEDASNSTLTTVPPAVNAATIGARRMVFDTEEGEAIFTFPDGLSEESIEDLEAWFALVVKRLRRTVKR